jgi:hypothetical protein
MKRINKKESINHLLGVYMGYFLFPIICIVILPIVFIVNDINVNIFNIKYVWSIIAYAVVFLAGGVYCFLSWKNALQLKKIGNSNTNLILRKDSFIMELSRQSIVNIVFISIIVAAVILMKSDNVSFTTHNIKKIISISINLYLFLGLGMLISRSYVKNTK